jgi:hypothetical protein
MGIVPLLKAVTGLVQTANKSNLFYANITM